MRALIRLYFISWWRGFVGPFFSFAFPIIMIVLLGQFIPFKYIAPTYLVYCAVTLGIQSLSISLVQFKNSSLIKRIGQTTITKKKFILSILIFNFFLIVLAIITTLIAMYFIQKFDIVKTSQVVKSLGVDDLNLKIKDKVIDHTINWSIIQWQYFPFILGVACFFSISIGLLLSTIFDTVEKVNGIGLILYFFLCFLSGIFFPLRYIKNSVILDKVSIFIPLRPTTESLYLAFQGELSSNSIFQLTTATAHGSATKALTLGTIFNWMLYPIIVAIIFVLLAIKLFKWE